MNKINAAYILCAIFLSSAILLKSNMNELYKGNRPASYPYISGDTFRICCDHIFDAKEQNFDPLKVRTGDVVFVAPRDYEHFTFCESMHDFFKHYHPLIKNKYILVTHNSDLNVTEEFRCYLESETLFVWFAQNVGFEHPKLIGIPIGLENELWGRNYVRMLNEIRDHLPGIGKKYMLYMNFNARTNYDVRMPVYAFFKDKDFCYAPPSTSTECYLKDVCKAKFVLSPHGNGLDCHRTWEALYLGVIPIVKKSTLDPLYQDLPVLIVDDWGEVTCEFLEKKYAEISSKNYKTEKLFIDYWLNILKKYKGLCRVSDYANCEDNVK